MTGQMLGLDPQDCQDLIKLLRHSAQQLQQTSTVLNQAVTRTSWQGPDSQHFRSQWPGQHTALQRTAHALDGQADVVLRNIAEQERASAVDGGNLLDHLFGGAKDLWDDVAHGVGSTVDGAVDEVKNGLGWLAGKFEANPLVKSSGLFLHNLGYLSMMGLRTLEGHPPSVSGLVSQLILTVGSGLMISSVPGLIATGMGVHLFDDGTPYAGEPVAVGNGTAARLQLPTSASAIFGSVEDAYSMGHEPGMKDGDIRIVKVQQSDGSSAYIVNIPGTEAWTPTGGGQARDLTSNVMIVAGQSTSASKDVALAMERAGIPTDAPVMLVGHSQGGMIAGQLASDPSFTNRFNVTNVMTAGSPIDGDSINPRIDVLAAQHAGDAVPKLDLGGVTTDGQSPQPLPNVTTVTMDDPPGAAPVQYSTNPFDMGKQELGILGNNHATDHYRNDLANTSKYPQVANYENSPSMRPFLSNDPSKVSAVDVPVGRR